MAFGCRETFSCLGDVFSINWMRDAANLTQTVGAQIDLVTNETAVPRAHTDPNHISHPQQYGDTTIRADQIGMFEGSAQFQHGKYSLCSSSTRHLLATFLLLFSLYVAQMNLPVACSNILVSSSATSKPVTTHNPALIAHIVITECLANDSNGVLQ